MSVEVELDYSKVEQGGPISIQDIIVYDSAGNDITNQYKNKLASFYGYNYADDQTLKCDLCNALHVANFDLIIKGT